MTTHGPNVFGRLSGGHPQIANRPPDPGKTYTWRSHVCDLAHVNTAANKEWKLTTLHGKAIRVASPPTMTFAKGRLIIFGRVNRLSGSYALIRDSVTLGELVSTRRAGPPELEELERNFARTLAAVDGFHVHGNQLALLSHGTVVATFRAGD